MTDTSPSATADPRYPIGRLQPVAEPTPEIRLSLIDHIRLAPTALRDAVEDLTDEQLDTPYREGGWTVRQLVHHLADSHLHAYTRFRFALTEEEATIKPYDEASWAQLEDARSAPVEISLDLLDALHERWVILLESMRDADWSRAILHPENGRMTVDRLLQVYAWHGRHHVAHVTALRERQGWG